MHARLCPILIAASVLLFVTLFSPQQLLASEGALAQFYVSAWLVRLWLGLVSGAVIVAGVLLALDSYSSRYTSDPVLTPDSQVQLVKQYQLSYRKIGGGLACVVLGCTLLVTTVFLLPDKRTGHSGVAKILERFNVSQVVVEKNGHADAQPVEERQHGETEQH